MLRTGPTWLLEMRAEIGDLPSFSYKERTENAM
jgi:hypothetical protein